MGSIRIERPVPYRPISVLGGIVSVNVKIITIGNHRMNRENDESKLTKYLNEGLVIVAAGGGEEHGFCVPQKEREES